MSKLCPSLLVASVLIGTGVVATALAAEPEEIIKYRRNVMKSQGAHLAATAAIIQGKVDYKDQLSGHVKALQATCNDIVGLFPKGSDFGDTEALDAVWQKPAEFEKVAKDAKAKVGALATAVAKGDTQSYATHLKGVVDACKACHKDFRKEQKQ
jgi:cytochrome c556